MWEKGIHPFESSAVMDLGASAGFAVYQVGACPTLTKTRCAERAWWNTWKGDFLTVDDMIRLQGFSSSTDIDWSAAGLSKSAAGGCLGNAVNGAMIGQLIPQVLYAANLATEADLQYLNAREKVRLDSLRLPQERQTRPPAHHMYAEVEAALDQV